MSTSAQIFEYPNQLSQPIDSIPRPAPGTAQPLSLSLSSSPFSSTESSSTDLYIMSHHQQQGGSNAPLPSPTHTQTDTAQYFGSIAQQQTTQQMQMSMQMPMQNGTTGRPPSLTGATPSNAGYSQSLQNFNLVAEAAKRAQVAVVARELEEVTL